MAIPPPIREDAETALADFCRDHSAGPVADQLRYTYAFAANAALLIEQRPSFMNPADWTSRPMAKFRYSEARNEWSLYWSDNSERWHKVPEVKAAKDIRVLLKVVLSDPVGVFWV